MTTQTGSDPKSEPTFKRKAVISEEELKALAAEQAKILRAGRIEQTGSQK